MKKTDTYYLSDKQIKQIKNNGKRRLFFAILLFALSCASGILLEYVHNITLELILTAILGVSGIGFIVVLVKGFGTKGGSFAPEVEKDIDEARKETGYFGK